MIFLQRWFKVKPTDEQTKCMAMALCERLPALMLLAYNITLLTLFNRVEPFQHAHECFLQSTCWRARSQMTLTDVLTMKHLFFSKCTVYNYASVSLLLAVLYLSSPGFLRAFQLQRSTVASAALNPADFPPPPAPPLLPASEWLTPTPLSALS